MHPPPDHASAEPMYRFPEGVMTQQVDGEMVLLDLRSEQYYGLDPVGADMVRRLTDQSRGQAVAGLCEDYEVQPERLEADLDGLVASLLAAGLLERSTGAA